MKRWWFFTWLVLIFIIAGCNSVQQNEQAVPKVEVSPTLSATPGPSGTPTRNIALETNAMQTRRAQETMTLAVQYTSIAKVNATQAPLETNRALSITPTQKPIILVQETLTPWTGLVEGTLLPANLEVISAENIQNLKEIARWGKESADYLRYSTDGSVFAIYTNAGVYIYNSSTYQQVSFFPLEINDSQVSGYAISPELKRIAIIQNDDSAEIWDIQAGLLIKKHDFRQVDEPSFIDEAHLAIGNLIWNIDNDTFINPGVTGYFRFSQDINRVAVINNTSFPEDVSVYSYPDFRKINAFRTSIESDFPSELLDKVELSPNGKKIILTNMAFAEQWDVDLNKRDWIIDFKTNFPKGYENPDTYAGYFAFTSALDGPDGPAESFSTFVKYSQDGTRIALLSFIKGILIIDTASGKTLNYLNYFPTKIQFSPDGNSLAMLNGNVHFIDPITGFTKKILEHTGYISRVVFSLDGQFLAAGSTDHYVYLYNVKNAKLIKSFAKHDDTIFDLDFTPDQKTLISTGADGFIYSWNVETGKGQKILNAGASLYRSSISADGKYLMASSRYSIYLIDLKTNDPKNILALFVLGDVHHPGLNDFSPSSPLLAHDKDGEISLFSFPDMKPLWIIKGGDSRAFCFSYDGKWLTDGTYIWDVKTGQALYDIDSSNPNFGWDVKFSLHKDLVFKTDGWGAIGLIYNLSGSSPEMIEVDGINDPRVNHLDISPNGKLLAAGYSDGTIHIFGVEP